MFSSAKKKSYSSVPSDEDDAGDDDASATDDLEQSKVETSTPPRRRPIRRREPRFHREPSSYGGCYSTFVLTLVGVAAMMTILFFASQTQWGNSLIPSTKNTGQSKLSLFPPSKDLDESTVEQVQTQAQSLNSKKKHMVHYNPEASIQSVNPFDFSKANDAVFTPPSLLQQDAADAPAFSSEETIGYLTHPHVVNNNIVFCSEGDAFVTTIGKNIESLGHAVKLTKTIGNVLDPKLHPSLRYLAYTATYTAHREIYLMDLVRPQSAAIRLTYWETGVHGLVGWWGNSLVFRALSNEVSLPDYRLYVLHLSNLEEGEERRLKQNATNASAAREEIQDNDKVSVLQIDPVPLSQAIDGSRYDSCWYFVRFTQSSHTMRYVGGTAESLWKYCDREEKATALTGDFKGTSKSPQVYNNDYIFFLSDRVMMEDKWQTDRMNVWAMPLKGDTSQLIQITDTACDFEGRTIREYSVDAQTGNLVIRIGADLYLMDKADVDKKLSTRRQVAARRLDQDNATLSSEVGGESGQDGTVPDATTNGKVTVDSTPSTFSPVPIVTEDNQGDDTIAPESPNDESVEPNQANITMDIESNATALGINTTNATEKEIPKVYYHFDSPALESRKKKTYQDHHSGTDELKRLKIVVHSDFSSHQERIIPVNMNRHKTSMDVYTTPVGTTQAIMTLRGQLWVAPVVDDNDVSEFRGGGMNLPPRRFKVAPGAMMGGVVRILAVRHVPNPIEDDESDRRLAVIIATDPLTETAEHAFYLIETQAGVSPTFLDMEHLPKPFLGGHVGGGSALDGGLGSIKPGTFVVSPCGRRMAWSDTDGRIMVMNMPQYQDLEDENGPKYEQLPKENELGEPMVGDEVNLLFSPGGRYLAVEHNARNQFSVISIVDLGDPVGDEKVSDIQVGRIVQATPSRFNSIGPYWGKSGKAANQILRDATLSAMLGSPPPEDVADVLFFLSDRDVQTDVNSPWGTRQPMPHFKSSFGVFALPMSAVNGTDDEGHFTGGGVSELSIQAELDRQGLVKSLLSAAKGRKLGEQQTALSGVFGIAGGSFDEKKRRYRHLQEAIESATADSGANATDTTLRPAEFPIDLEIDFGSVDLSFARQAYRVANIPEGDYGDIVCQTSDAGALVLTEEVDGQSILTMMKSSPFPSDNFEAVQLIPKGWKLESYGLSTSRDHLYLGFAPIKQIVVVPATVAGFTSVISDVSLEQNKVDADDIHLSVWPALEYRQLYDDAWRMLRDYFYDPDITGIDWPSIHERYLPLVSRCTKREELDDVLIQMASELSALHVFVYGGEYEQPQFLDRNLQTASVIASFGAVLKRAPEWNGYKVESIPEHDPDFNIVDGSEAIFSPLHDRTLRLSGQQGLQVGDIIVGVNGESVMKVPDIHILLRGMQGRSVRLDVLRLSSGEAEVDGSDAAEAETTPLITVPLAPYQASELRYSAWEWKTRQAATKLADEAGFSVGYVHLRDMVGPEAENAFARGFFPNYDKEAFILDVRHNNGGNIDSWVLDVLQKHAWMYWQSRDFDTTNGGLGWDQQFAFRGHIVVLIDEKTASDGEGVSRGISELGLGRLIGTRTWGGGIWLASDNHLVDGGIATAPEIGTYNDKFGWGMGIEQMGVEPDVVVDNDPHQTYNGKDSQLERAIAELKDWLEKEPVVVPKPPKKKKDMTMGDRECPAK